MLKLSVVGCPLAAIAMLLAASWLWATCRPFPLTPILYIAVVATMFMAPSSAEARVLIALLIACGSIYIEAITRDLPKNAYVVASLCLAVTGCYYMTISSLMAGAFV